MKNVCPIRAQAYHIEGYYVAPFVLPLFAVFILAFFTLGESYAIHLAIAFTILFMTIFWLYFALQESSPKQATFGKHKFGLVVVDTAGRRISFARASLRFWLFFLSGLSLGLLYLLCTLDRDCICLHDRLSKTRVVLR
ncbi:putative membrane protein [Desulfocurvibacter africanus PCS]|uniref:Putative membrane protein n=1 Tax=Desulfocurvibacter africanus PCS TaxID=1262666 RepID=M5Q3A7_DESAF|nr:RDD family protein [Desulfocurvibacter africanus]EMG38118.1 putative membrane protein [Desulfocurvibacter africanus PCS]